MSAYLPYVIAAAVFMVALGVALFAASAMQARRRARLVQRLAGERAREQAKGRRQWLQRVATQGQRLDRLVEDPEETTVLLAQAGWRGARARAGFYTAQLVLPIVAALFAIPLWFGLRGSFGVAGALLVLVVFVLAAAVLPRMVLRSAAKSRRERIRAEVPLFINLLILLFEAGLSTRQALTSLVQDGGGTLPELISELAPVLRQIEAGGETATLLLQMSKTLSVAELESVLGVLRQVEQYGGEVREPLADALVTIEERRNLDLREKVNIMSGKMTVVLVACFFPALLVFIVGPAFVSIYRALSSI